MSAGRVVAGCVLVASVALGCSGGDPGGGRDAPSARAFCDALGRFSADVEAADRTDVAAYVRALKAAAVRLDGVGLPDGVPDSARAGFELTIRRIEALSDDATEDDLARLGDAGVDDEATLDDLAGYVAQTCPQLTQSDSPSPSQS